MHILIIIYAQKDGDVMKDMNELVKEYDYLTPKLARSSGISKFKFYKYVEENIFKPCSMNVFYPEKNPVEELISNHISPPEGPRLFLI